MILTKEKPAILFYQNLGLLFYAIAAADKVVHKAEFDVLKNIIKTTWKAYEMAKDDYDETVTYQMEVVFEWFDYEKRDAKECFTNFSEYAIEHPEKFSIEKRKLITETANSIASAFASKNKSELIMLAKLELLFNKLKTK